MNDTLHNNTLHYATPLNDTINIAASCDDNYAQHLGVMLQSLLNNARTPTKIHIYILSSAISEKNIENFSCITDRFQSQLTIIPTDESKYQDLPKLRYGSAALQRISLPDYLPENLDKVIYLDSDLIVLDDIRDLWEIPINGKPIAAVENLSPKAHKDLGFERNEYFNSGVLVIDVRQWRQLKTSDQVLEIMQTHIDKLRFFDQCGLNKVLQGKWHKLPLRWNQQADIYGVFKKYADGCGYSKTEIRQAILNPAIVHFIGTQKPWELNCFHPFKADYHDHLKQTPWEAAKFSDESPMNRLKYYLSLRKHAKRWCRKRDIVKYHNKKPLKNQEV